MRRQLARMTAVVSVLVGLVAGASSVSANAATAHHAARTPHHAASKTKVQPADFWW